jgi:hypothetical protein
MSAETELSRGDAGPGDAAIEIIGVSYRFGEHLAVNSVDLSVKEGECFGLLGPYGAGKPVKGLRHSLLARKAGFRSPGQRPSSPTRPPSWTYCVCRVRDVLLTDDQIISSRESRRVRC